ncbi:MAG: C25 family cysteine peptidase, partial [Candidatus Eisenbacteria bacterium]|nr:C25 family cysteine peptidase [Candidatus Eisenbacteria bacterium]
GAKDAAPALPGTWLLICDPSPEVTSRLAPLVAWRERKGYPVRVATTGETGGSKEQIKAWIQNAWDTWDDPPEFVVLAGDASGSWSIPTWNETISTYHGEGDHPYVQLAGDDILADAHVGRLSFSQLSELETIVAKMVGYETQPPAGDPDWFTRACLTGDPYASGYSTVQVMQWIKSRLREGGYSRIDTVFTQPFVSQMTSSLNSGVSLFAYRGIYGMSGWGVGNTLGLVNAGKLPFCVVITCDTGSFQYGYSRSEAFLRVGTPEDPRGGIGCVGTATTGTHTRYNNCYTYGIFDGLLYRQAWEMGAAHTWGKLNLWRNYADTEYGAVVRFSYWNNLMGDPAGEVWTAAPRTLAVTHLSLIHI